MDGPLPNLAGAPWFTDPAVESVFDLLTRDGGQARIVGGAVRNALTGRSIEDIDFATTLDPEEVVARAARAGIRAVPTGIEHGTVTLVFDGGTYEITTLREDVETDGRRAVVRFGSDWAADARRRDFTINALSADAAGRVHDPLGGYADIVARRLRFIGDPGERIAEDRLRILRLFRFHAAFPDFAIPDAHLEAAIRARDGLRLLSAERLGAEMRLLAVAPGAAAAARLMQESGVLPVVLGGIGYLRALERLIAFENPAGVPVAFPLRMAALACRVAEDVVRVAARLRLSNAEAGRMRAALAAAAEITADGRDDRQLLRVLYRHAAAAYRDGVALAHSHRTYARADAVRAYGLPDRASVPRFPVSGAHVVALGVGPGPAVGRYLRELEDWWIDRDFAPDEAALLRRLETMRAQDC